MAQSTYGKVNKADLLKGLWVSVGAAVALSLYGAVNDGVDFPTVAELWEALRAGLAASLGYVIKNVFTNSDGELGKKEQ